MTFWNSALGSRTSFNHRLINITNNSAGRRWLWRRENALAIIGVVIGLGSLMVVAIALFWKR
jgi:hypothetical protein